MPGRRDLQLLKEQAASVQFHLEGTPYVAEAVLGTGAYGVVCSAVSRTSGRRVAIKKIPDAFSAATVATRTLREIRILAHFRHDNIVAIKDLIKPSSVTRVEDFRDVYVVLDFMETDLHKIIHSKQPITEDHVSYLLYQILRGVKYIHSANVLHRDLKPSNIMVNRNCDLKIGDFGMSRCMSSSAEDHALFMTRYVATRWYRAPELMFSLLDYSAALDLWSVGCILGEMLARRVLFPGKDYIHQLKLILAHTGAPSEAFLQLSNSDMVKQFVLGLGPLKPVPWTETFPGTTSVPALHLVSRLLQLNPRERCSVDEALGHSFLHKYARGDEPTARVPFFFDTMVPEDGDHPEKSDGNQTHLGEGITDGKAAAGTTAAQQQQRRRPMRREEVRAEVWSDVLRYEERRRRSDQLFAASTFRRVSVGTSGSGGGHPPSGSSSVVSNSPASNAPGPACDAGGQLQSGASTIAVAQASTACDPALDGERKAVGDAGPVGASSFSTVPVASTATGAAPSDDPIVSVLIDKSSVSSSMARTDSGGNEQVRAANTGSPEMDGNRAPDNATVQHQHHAESGHHVGKASVGLGPVRKGTISDATKEKMKAMLNNARKTKPDAGTSLVRSDSKKGKRPERPMRKKKSFNHSVEDSLPVDCQAKQTNEPTRKTHSIQIAEKQQAIASKYRPIAPAVAATAAQPPRTDVANTQPVFVLVNVVPPPIPNDQHAPRGNTCVAEPMIISPTPESTNARNSCIREISTASGDDLSVVDLAPSSNGTAEKLDGAGEGTEPHAPVMEGVVEDGHPRSAAYRDDPSLPSQRDGLDAGRPPDVVVAARGGAAGDPDVDMLVSGGASGYGFGDMDLEDIIKDSLPDVTPGQSFRSHPHVQHLVQHAAQQPSPLSAGLLADWLEVSGNMAPHDMEALEKELQMGSPSVFSDDT